MPPSLKFVAVGGASVAVELLERAAAVGLPVYEGYGLSECASVVCLNTPAARRPGSVGRPLPHARVRVDADGQLMVSGVTMRGYLGDPPRTAGRGVGDRRPRRDRCRRLRVRARPHRQHVHHELRAQRLAGVGRARDRARARASATCWCTARRGHTPSRSSARRATAPDAATIERAIACRERARCRTTRRCAAGCARPSLSRSRTGC